MHSKISVERIHSFTGHTDCIYSIEQCSSREFFFSAGGDGLVVKWDLENPENGELIAKMSNSVYALHFLMEQDTLLVGENYQGVHLLDWQKRKELNSLKISDSYIFDIKSFKNRLFVGSGDGFVTIIDLSTWKIISKIGESKKSARAIAINEATNELAIGYSDYFIRIFDLSNLQKKKEWHAHSNSVFTLAYANDSKTLLSASRDARIKAWQVNSNYQLTAEVAAHLYAINHIAFSPDGSYFATASMDKSVKIWDSNTLQLLKVVDKARHAGHGTSVNKLLWIDKNRILSAGDDRVINEWQVENAN